MCAAALALLLAICLRPAASHAAEPLPVDPSAAAIDLVSQAEVILHAAPAEAWSELPDARWSPLPPNGAVGVPEAPVWVRVRLRAPAQMRRMVHVNDPGIVGADLVHVRPDGSVTSLANYPGDGFASRVVPAHAQVFPVDLPPGSSTIYLRMLTDEAMNVRLRLLTAEQLGAEQQRVRLTWAAYFGLLGGLAVYNLFLWLTLRDRAYLLYVVMVTATHGLLQLHPAGLLMELLPTWSPSAVTTLGRTLVGVGVLALAAFVWDFLQAGQRAPWTRWLFVPWLGLAGVLLVNGLLPAWLAFSATMALLGFSPAVLSAVSVESWRSGHRQALWFLLAWLTVIVAAVWTLLRGLGLVPLIGFQGLEFIIGSAVEACLLSLALADRIRGLQREQREAQVRAEVLRRHAAEASLSAEMQKSAFLSMMSHELRTPLHQVLGLADLLMYETSEPSMIEDLALLKRCGQDLHSLIDDMLLFAELQGGGGVTLRAVHLEALARRASAEHQVRAQAAGLSWSLSSRGPAAVMSEPRLLQTAIDHLVDNAIRYTEHGFVDVQIDAQDTGSASELELVLAVTDSGPGIPQERLDELTAAFQQREHGLRRSSGGIGLGLAMCRTIATALGGTLTIEDLDGAGTRVVMRLPTQAAQLSAPVDGFMATTRRL